MTRFCNAKSTYFHKPRNFQISVTLSATDPVSRAPTRVPSAESVSRDARLSLVEHKLALASDSFLGAQVAAERTAADSRAETLTRATRSAGNALEENVTLDNLHPTKISTYRFDVGFQKSDLPIPLSAFRTVCDQAPGSHQSGDHQNGPSGNHLSSHHRSDLSPSHRNLRFYIRLRRELCIRTSESFAARNLNEHWKYWLL